MTIYGCRYLTGARVLDTHIYQAGSYPFDLIAPITVIWRPMIAPPATADAPAPSEPVTSGKKQKKNKKGKGKAPDEGPKSSKPEDAPRTVWIRSHPSVFDDVFSALQACTSRILDVARQNGRRVEVELADLRGAVNVFEVMGPKANQVIKGALSLVADDERADLQKVRLTETQYYSDTSSDNFTSSGRR
jgi:ribonuclease P/MRP protein subunit POP1